MKPHGAWIFFSVGLIAAATAALIVYAVKKGAIAHKYDERQMQARNRAYCSAFWTLVAYVLLNGLFELVQSPWADGLTAAFVGVCVAVMVFASVCVWNDAYFAFNESPRRYVLLFVGVALINGGTAVLNAASGAPFFTEDGLLGFRWLNVIVVIMFLFLAAVLGLKTFLRRKRRGEDE